MKKKPEKPNPPLGKVAIPGLESVGKSNPAPSAAPDYPQVERVQVVPFEKKKGD